MIHQDNLAISMISHGKKMNNIHTYTYREWTLDMLCNAIYNILIIIICIYIYIHMYF